MKEWLAKIREIDLSNWRTRIRAYTDRSVKGKDGLSDFDTLEDRQPFPARDWLGGLGQWDELASEVGRESRARVALVGLPGGGKSLMFNRLRGWDISPPRPTPDEDGLLRVESYGMFLLADLWEGETPTGEELAAALGEPELVIYVFDGSVGVQQADFRYVAQLRAAGKPVVVVLNKADCLAEGDTSLAVAEAERRLGMPVLPVSAMTGVGVEDGLLPALLDAAPRLAVPLGREICVLRRAASRRMTRQAALMAGILSAQPVPLLDLPFQAMLQAGIVMRIGAAYGLPPTGGLSREVIGTVAGALALRYAAQTLLKFVPILGWALSGFIGAGATLLVGEAAILYYESDRKLSLRAALRRNRVSSGQ
jgi:uncharacterized protein (DUF697 family)